MANETIAPLGAVFGPDFVEIVVNDETNKQYHLEVYPDANNALLKANGLPTQYYFVPQRVYLAKKQDAPDDFDFGATIFKGLMTTEDSVGVTDAMTSSGAVSTGGGFCVFSTTFAIPDSVIANATAKLKSRDHPAPPPGIAGLFNFEPADPDPMLGIVPIVDNNVTIEVPKLAGVGSANAPFFIDAQGTGKGSIEAAGISAFLVTLNELAAGAIVGALKDGQSPFTVHYNLKQQFYINACDIHVIIDVDKVFDSFSAALSVGGFLGIDSASMSYSYSNCVTSGAIKTIMHMNNAAVPDNLQQMIMKQVEQMQQNAFDLVKKEIFDWQPSDSGPATTDRGIFSSVFGGSSVSLKSNYQKRSIKLENDLTIDSSITVFDTKSGDLADLQPAIKANLDKYLAIVDIGEYFKKLQIAATNNINWSEKLPDGTNLADPVMSAQVQMSYPDYDQPLAADKSVNLRTQANGFHYLVGQANPTSPGALAQWTADNPRDVINIASLRLDKSVPGWPTDQVKVRKTIVYSGDDPRVELANKATVFVKEELTTNHAPVITADEVGYVFVKFMVDRPLPAAVSLTLVCTIGTRSDTITITSQNQKNVLWEIFSDKYFDATTFTYLLQAEVASPTFTEAPVTWGNSEAVTVAIPPGRIKYLNPYKLRIPDPPANQIATINKYIKEFMLAPAG